MTPSTSIFRVFDFQTNKKFMEQNNYSTEKFNMVIWIDSIICKLNQFRMTLCALSRHFHARHLSII